MTIVAGDLKLESKDGRKGSSFPGNNWNSFGFTENSCWSPKGLVKLVEGRQKRC